MPVRLVVADDHPLILDGLIQLFSIDPEFEIVARATNGEEALERVKSERPDVLILDVRMPGIDGIEVLRRLRSEGPPTRIVLLTAGLDDTRLLDAFRLGASGIVLKEMAPRLLVESVRAVARGGQCWDHVSVAGALRQLLKQEEMRNDAAAVLTPREVEITRMVASGLRNKEIAKALSITEGTVKLHLNNIYEKLRIDGRVALTIFARDHGLA